VESVAGCNSRLCLQRRLLHNIQPDCRELGMREPIVRLPGTNPPLPQDSVARRPGHLSRVISRRWHSRAYECAVVARAAPKQEWPVREHAVVACIYAMASASLLLLPPRVQAQGTPAASSSGLPGVEESSAMLRNSDANELFTDDALAGLRTYHTSHLLNVAIAPDCPHARLSLGYPVLTSNPLPLRGASFVCTGYSVQEYAELVRSERAKEVECGDACLQSRLFVEKVRLKPTKKTTVTFSEPTMTRIGYLTRPG
jgi:hypothetical protein